MATKVIEANKEEISGILAEYLKDLEVGNFVDLSAIEERLKRHLISALPNEIVETLQPLMFGKNQVAKFGLVFENKFVYSEKICFSFKVVKLSNNPAEPDSHPQISVIGLGED